MAFPAADWERVNPASQGVSPTLLEEAVGYLGNALPSNGNRAEGLAIIRDGRLIWEGSQARIRAEVASVTKSVTTTVLATLIDDGLLDLDTVVKDISPSIAPPNSTANLRHLATMTSNIGLGWEPPGSQFQYSNDTFDRISQAITVATGSRLSTEFRTRIAELLGMGTTAWSFGTPGQVDGLPYDWGGFGLSIAAVDAARFGHLFLNDGSWDGTQIVSAEWVNESTRIQVDAATPLNPGSGTPFGPGRYGYGWWTNVGEPGVAFMPNWPSHLELYAAVGQDANYVIVIPEHDLVIARTSSATEPLSLDEFGEFVRLVDLAVDAIPAGDFNGDLVVDAADYTVWRDGLGGSYSAADYDAWRANFGRVGMLGSASATVPEPSTLASMAVLVAAWRCRLR